MFRWPNESLNHRVKCGKLYHHITNKYVAVGKMEPKEKKNALSEC